MPGIAGEGREHTPARRPKNAPLDPLDLPLPSHPLNDSEALVFGPEQNRQVPVRLVDVSEEVRAAVGWAKGTELKFGVECLEEVGLPPALTGPARRMVRRLLSAVFSVPSVRFGITMAAIPIVVLGAFFLVPNA